jgi:hypothetical protein
VFKLAGRADICHGRIYKRPADADFYLHPRDHAYIYTDCDIYFHGHKDGFADLYCQPDRDTFEVAYVHTLGHRDLYRLAYQYAQRDRDEYVYRYFHQFTHSVTDMVLYRDADHYAEQDCYAVMHAHIQPHKHANIYPDALFFTDRYPVNYRDKHGHAADMDLYRDCHENLFINHDIYGDADQHRHGYANYHADQNNYYFQPNLHVHYDRNSDIHADTYIYAHGDFIAFGYTDLHIDRYPVIHSYAHPCNTDTDRYANPFRGKGLAVSGKP